jgi:RNA polymerase sigma-70 factor (ECF subfamily)
MTSVVRWEPARRAMMSSGAGPALPGSFVQATDPGRTSEAPPTDRTWTTAREDGTSGDDRRTVEAVLAGDRDAFRRLVEREGPPVVAACTRVLGDRSEAEDVAQEAFVIAYRSLGSWRAEGPFGAWVSRIAVRLAIRRAAQRKQVVWLDPLAADADLPGRERFRTATPHHAADPAHTVLRSERDAQLRAAVAALDEPYREVVAMRFFAERSLNEIAAATGRPLGTVKTHLHRGLARLRGQLGEVEP